MKQYSISQVLQVTEILLRILLSNLAKTSSKIKSSYRKFINRCNSLFIIFAQFEILAPAFEVIYKAFTTDLKVFFYNNTLDKTWEGRILLYCNMGYMMFLVNDYTSSLKFLYDAESLIKEALNKNTIYLRDLILAHSSLTFLIMFRARRYENVEKYVFLIF